MGVVRPALYLSTVADTGESAQDDDRLKTNLVTFATGPVRSFISLSDVGRISFANRSFNDTQPGLHYPLARVDKFTMRKVQIQPNTARGHQVIAVILEVWPKDGHRAEAPTANKAQHDANP
ncbi:MAG: hypothetical protein AB8B71_04525 [Paracoccaceae bacterium]